MRIALLTCPTSLNAGNEFINIGAEYLIKQIFPNEHIDLFEALETVNQDNKSFIKPFQKELNSYDIIFIACGSLISEYAIQAIRNILSLKPIKIWLGLGMFNYDEIEISYCKEMEKVSNNYFFIRDDETYKAFDRSNNNVFRGIDCAFYLSDIHKKLNNKKRYAVINIDSLQDNIPKIKNTLNDLKKHYKYVYIIENTSTTKHNIPKFKDHYLFLSHWYSLYQLYQNASFVITNRVHTAIACLSNNVPVCFTWTYKNIPVTPRIKLFKRVGVFVKPDCTILEQNKDRIEKYKAEFSDKLKCKINEIISKSNLTKQ